MALFFCQAKLVFNSKENACQNVIEIVVIDIVVRHKQILL